MSDSGWDEEEDLFSFGVDGADADAQAQPAGGDDVNKASGSSNMEADGTRERSGSDDSFLEMLDTSTGTSGLGVPSAPTDIDDTEAQEILNWLDSDNDQSNSEDPPPQGTQSTPPVPEAEQAPQKKETASSSQSQLPQVEQTTADDPAKESPEPTANGESDKENGGAPSTPKQDPPNAASTKPTQTVQDEKKRPELKTLEEALKSEESTLEQLKRLFIDARMNVHDRLRSELWARFVCGKSVKKIVEGSLADSYMKWKSDTDISSLTTTKRSQWIHREASILAERIVTTTGMSVDDATDALASILLFYLKADDSEECDPLLPPVACTILSTGIPVPAASVMLSTIMPTFIPLLALTQTERAAANRTLYQHFYLLACYHIPLLVFHLDRYAPGWYWPKTSTPQDGHEQSAVQRGRNLEKQGVVPSSWLISHLAGECGGALMNPKWLLSLWDMVLTSSNNSLRFFLVLAVLEKYSEALLMVSGEELLHQLNRILDFNEGASMEGFAIESDDFTTSDEAVDFVQEWVGRARVLCESTPKSIITRLRYSEDQAVSKALIERQERAEEELMRRMEEENRAKEAEEKEKETRAEEGRQRLNRTRLQAYYQRYNPERQGNVDKIMEMYKGRLEVLDAKLKIKYGVGFNPALKPPPMSKNTSKLLSTMNLGPQQRRFFATRKRNGDNAFKEAANVTVSVSPTEVLPVVCWTKEASQNKGAAKPLNALRFYLVDSRPGETIQEQGSFPTALSMSPEALLDPDKIVQMEELFESLRGAVHIVVMGEGFSSVPALYGQKLNPSLMQLIKEDESRTQSCALFFVKKGFPFVSILEGGFAGAHSWLHRDGKKYHLDASSVLIDYHGEETIFGQLEKAHREQQEFASASAGERTQRVVQNLFDSSLTAITRNKTRFDHLASELETSQGRQKVRDSVAVNVSKVTNLFKTDEVSTRFTAKKKEETQPIADNEVDGQVRFRNPFTAARPESSKATAAAPLPNAQSSQIKPNLASSVEKTAADTPPVLESTQNRFAGIGAAINKSIKDVTSSSTLGTNSEQQPIENRLAGFGAAINQSLRNAADRAEENQTENRFSGMAAALNKSLKNISSDRPSDSTQTNRVGSFGASANNGTSENRFAGFGASLQKSFKSTTESTGAQQLLARNPFAGFGGGSKEKTSSNTGSGASAMARFGRGLNFRANKVHGTTGGDDVIDFS